MKRGTLFTPPAVDLERRAAGALLLRSPVPLASYANRVGDWLEHWADVEPDRIFLAERAGDGSWQTMRYGDVAVRVGRLAAGLMRRKLGPERPLRPGISPGTRYSRSDGCLVWS